LRVLPIEEELFSLRRSTLPPSNPAAEAEVCAVLGVSSLKDIHYRIIHMGTGAAQRELDRWFWRELAEKLGREHRVLFTGHGAREHQKIEQVIHGLGNCVNACNVLSWEGFVAAVRHAEVLYGVESMAGHVAGAVGTKCVVVYGGTAGVGRWRPEGNGSLVMTNHVPCAPCLQVEGCAAMHCMKNIRPDDLVDLHV
jgi:ADP-heptose:LPS heptosyltransferase